MNMHDQVVSLELAKKLKELNVDFPSIFSWDYYSDTCYDVKFIPFSCPDNKNFKAYTASELFEIIPQYVTIDKSFEPFNNFIFTMKKIKIVQDEDPILFKHGFELVTQYSITYESDTTEAFGEKAWFKITLAKSIFDKNLCNALAKVIIWLIEDGLMEITK